jgi:hypothetical protein
MKRKSTIISLVIALTLVSFACNKSGGSAANMSDDDKYKLIVAASKTGDQALMADVAKKTGLVNSDGSPSEESKKFTQGAFEWGMKNSAWLKEIDTPEKAKEYVKSHLP